MSLASAFTPGEGRGWTGRLASYHQPSSLRSTLEIITAVPFVALWALTAVAVVHGFWGGLVLTVPAAGFLVRLFVLQHDCDHRALFVRRRTKDWIGRVLGVLILTPYDYWRRSHAVQG